MLARPRYMLHLTPACPPWVGQVVRWLAGRRRRCRERGVSCSPGELTTAVDERIRLWDQGARPFTGAGG